METNNSEQIKTNDLSVRVASFNGELKALLGKYELALYAEARIAEGRIVADPRIADARPKPEATESPETAPGEAISDEVGG